jgi:hypothetical protein
MVENEKKQNIIDDQRTQIAKGKLVEEDLKYALAKRHLEITEKDERIDICERYFFLISMIVNYFTNSLSITLSIFFFIYFLGKWLIIS